MNLPDTTKAEPIFREFNVAFAGVFGSYSRGEQNKDSDIDLFVRFSKTPGLFEFVELEQRLSDVLGLSVDLVTENSVSPYIRPFILKDLRPIYGNR